MLIFVASNLWHFLSIFGYIIKLHSNYHGKQILMRSRLLGCVGEDIFKLNVKEKFLYFKSLDFISDIPAYN